MTLLPLCSTIINLLFHFNVNFFITASRNIKGLYFAGALTHERDYKRGAGGFIHGFRYTARALTRNLNHQLPSDRPGATKWPATSLTKNEFMTGEHMLKRINEMAGKYLKRRSVHREWKHCS